MLNKRGRVIVVVLFLVGCVTFEPRPTIMPTPVRYIVDDTPKPQEPISSLMTPTPAQAVLVTPVYAHTPTTEPDFQCWTSAADTPNLISSAGQLIIVYNDRLGTDTQSLYRFDFSKDTYSAVASGIRQYYESEKSSFVSPNGTHLWYAISQASNRRTIFVYSLVDGAVHPIPFPEDSQAGVIAWSADGQCLIAFYVSPQGEESSVAYRLADGALQQRPIYAGYYPSPKGRWWADGRESGICIRDWKQNQISNDALQLPVKTDAEGHDFRYGLIRWSPDGQTLAFAYANDHFLSLDVIRVIFFKDDAIVSYRDFLSPGIGDLEWSPNSHQLLVTDVNGDGSHVYEVSTDQLTLLPVPHEYSSMVPPVWSPDGKQIAFLAKDNQTIYIAQIDGTNMIPLPAVSTSEASHSGISGIHWVP